MKYEATDAEKAVIEAVERRYGASSGFLPPAIPIDDLVRFVLSEAAMYSAYHGQSV